MTPIRQIRELVKSALRRPHTDLADEWIKARPGCVVLDIGAFHGGYIAHWFALGASEVHAFEPVPHNFDQLTVNWGKEKRVILNRLAVSDSSGVKRGVRVLGAHTLGSPSNIKLGVALEDRGPFDMDVTAIDTYLFCRPKVAKIGFCKLDVDGFEPAALRGMQQTLAKDRPAVMLELSGLPGHFGESCETMIRWIYERGYTICAMDGTVCGTPTAVMECYPWHSSFDVMMIPNENVQPGWPRID